MKIKVCGMREKDNIAALCQLPIDFIGFIFYPKSSRYVESLPNVELPKVMKRVGVFVNASIEEIEQRVNLFDLDFIQLHGDETPEYCQTLKTKGYQLIKAFAADSSFDFQLLEAYEAYCDFFLLDAKGESYGGNGVQFDWRILENYQSNKLFFLSGGIDLGSIAAIRALKIPQLYAIDVNSKFEIKPGLKDINKVKNLTSNMKRRYQIDAQGYYGEFGGAYIPEMLYPNIEELKSKYLKIMRTEGFQKEFNALLKDYVGRPTPLYFAKRLSEKYKTNIYLKREDLCHTGAHKINNTIGQILVAKALNKPRIIAETGAGQHGVATATVCALMGLECIVYMGAVDVERQAPNVARMKMLGARVVPVHSGSKTLKDATNEAIRDWISNPEDTHYIIGSVVGPHPYPDMVAQFQSVISKEIKKQLKEQTGSDNPDKVIACIGGGSNAAGAFFHYLDEDKVDLIAVEAAGEGLDSGKSAATSVLGTVGVIHASKTLLMQTKDGQVVEPHSISAGLDYPGIGPLHAHLIKTGRVNILSVSDKESLTAAYELTKLEGIIPALESAHALAALGKLEFKPNEVVVLNLSGRGDKDLGTYMKYMQ